MSLSTRIFWILVAALLVASGAFAIGVERRRAEHPYGGGAAAEPR